MYERFETFIIIKNLDNIFNERDLISKLIVKLDPFFDESELDNIGTVFRNKEKKLLLFLYDNHIQCMSKGILPLSEYIEKLNKYIDIIFDTANLSKVNCQFQFFIWGSLKSGKPFFKSITTTPKQLKELGELVPSVVIYSVQGKLNHEMMLLRKDRGLGYSFKFNEALKDTKKELPILFQTIFKILEETNIPHLLQATKSRR